MIKNKRAIAIITCITIVFALFFSVFFIAAESNHRCTGDQCPICQELQICEQTLKTVGTVAFVSAVVAAVAFSLLTLSLSLSERKAGFTLISLKVKLID